MKVKHEQIGEDFKKLLGEMVASPNVTLEELKTFCIELINKGVSSRAKKDTFIREVQTAKRKDMAAWPVYSYILAGEGNKVG
jgi:hypothetical protein